MFSARGYYAVSMRDLATALGIRAPSIYSFVSGKDALRAQCIAPYLQAIRELTERDPEGISALVLNLFKIFESHDEAMVFTHRDPACFGDATMVDELLTSELARYDVPRAAAWPVLAVIRDPWMRPGPPSEAQRAAVHLMVLRATSNLSDY